MARWHLELLGGISLRAEGEGSAGGEAPGRFYSQKSALLLARLALPPIRSYGREELVDFLWPDRSGDPSAGRANLRNLLAAVRRQLEPARSSPGSGRPCLEADNARVGLNPEVISTDVAEFLDLLKRARRAGGEAEYEVFLRQALALYRGELMPGVYADWVVTERGGLSIAYEEALRSLHELAAHQGDVGESRNLAWSLGKADEPAADDENGVASTAPPAPFLPPTRFAFFGREREQGEVRSLLRDGSTLVTLTGVGGVGKTRLAREIARKFANGERHAAFVALESTRDARRIPDKIFQTLAMTAHPGLPPLARVSAALRERNIGLLVLDNLEHLLAADADAVRELLATVSALPDVACLVTSQRPTHLAGECLYPLAPLPVPSDRVPNPAVLSRNPSVQVFVDRARIVRPDFELTARNAAAVASVCRQLEGLPLALEIAGARALVTTPWQIQAELEHRLAFLARRVPANPALLADRHHSLRSTLEWSFGLLAPELVRFAARLSVFRGSFTAAAARHVGGEADALGLLEELCQASLLVPEASGETMRFRYLESVREFARERLESSGEVVETRTCHLTWYVELSEEASSALTGPTQDDWLQRLEQEHDNLRSALAFAASPAGDPREMPRLACNLWRFWQTRGHLEEGVAWLRQAFALIPDSEEPEARRARARTSNSLGSLLIHLSRFAEAREAFATALCLYESLDAPEAYGPLNNLGLIHLYNGEHVAARDAFTRCVEITGLDGDPKLLSSFLNNRGMAHLHLEDQNAAEEDLLAALRLYEQLENTRGIAKALNNLGGLATERAQYTLAEERFRRSLELHEALGDREAAILCHMGLASSALALGDAVEGTRQFALSEALRQHVGCVVRPVDRARHSSLRANVVAAVGEAELLRRIAGQLALLA
jgi:predicted ATPase/DNA-binding SARP family transcriptional activator